MITRMTQNSCNEGYSSHDSNQFQIISLDMIVILYWDSLKLLKQTSKNNKLNQSAQQRPYQYPRIDPGTFHSSPPQAS